MKFELKIESDNEAMASGDTWELTRILGEVASKLAQDAQDGIVRDINGNTIGSWRLDWQAGHGGIGVSELCES